MLPVLLCCQMYQRDKHTVHHPRSTLRWDTASETVDFELKLVVRRDHCSIRWLHESAKQRPAQTSHNHETTPMRMRDGRNRGDEHATECEHTSQPHRRTRERHIRREKHAMMQAW